jgi:hypothetical protein
MDRHFVTRHITVSGKLVACRFWVPEAHGREFRCTYEIDWVDQPPLQQSAYGVDEVQALLLAMQAAHTDLLIERQSRGTEVSWLNQANLDLPLLPALRGLAHPRAHA